MPEVITKYPSVLIQELKDAGGKCGTGMQPKILKSCPPAMFCSLPTGEICVYDYKDAFNMTQISRAEWKEIVTGVPGMFSASNLTVLFIIFSIGFAIGTSIIKRRK